MLVSPSQISWTVLRITPNSAMLFRDTRPFSSGDDAVTLKTPMPSTVAGALRTLIAQQRKLDFSNKNTIATVKEWSIQGPIVVFGETAYFPAPLDAYVTAKKVHRLRPFKLQQGEGCHEPPEGGFLGLNIEGEKDKEDFDAPKLWPFSLLERWLIGEGISREELQQGVTLETESRTHVKINNKTGTAEDGMLFSTQNVYLWKTASGTLPEAGSWLVRTDQNGDFTKPIPHRLGGEGRIAFLESGGVWPSMPDSVLNALKNASTITMTLATPAYFAQGWNPDMQGLNGEYSLPDLPDLRLRLTAAAIPRWKPIAGWDYDRKQSKPLRRLVPAGAVYWFEVLHGDPAQLKDHWLTSVCTDPQSRKDGFGLALWGVPPKEV